MSRKMKCVACVLGVVAVALWAGTLRAETYNANTEMYASEIGATPSPTFGTWSLGSRTAAASTAFTTFPIAATATTAPAGTSGWDYSLNNMPVITVNTTGSTINFPVNDLVSTGIYTHPNDNTAANEYGVIRWTAPHAGTVDVSAYVLALGQGTSDEHLVLNGTSLLNGALNGTDGPTSWNGSQLGIVVSTGDKLDLAVGNGAWGVWANATGVSYSVTYVPEPSSIVLLISGLIGLIAYAWRKRR